MSEKANEKGHLAAMVRACLKSYDAFRGVEDYGDEDWCPVFLENLQAEGFRVVWSGAELENAHAQGRLQLARELIEDQEADLAHLRKVVKAAESISQAAPCTHVRTRMLVEAGTEHCLDCESKRNVGGDWMAA